MIKVLQRVCFYILLCLSLSSCGGGGGSSSKAEISAEELLAERPYPLKIPASYDENNPTPLVVLLHSFGGSSDHIINYFMIEAAAERYGFLIAHPDGLFDSEGFQYWDISQASDDVVYLTAIIDDVESNYNIDPSRIYMAGYSNGGFMSHRMACDPSERVAAIVSLAGAGWKDPARCAPVEPVSILHVHGDLDEAIFYSGDNNYPSALEVVFAWADYNGCSDSLVDINGGANLDIDQSVADNETRAERIEDCSADGEIQLWTIIGGGHMPELDASWADLIWGFMAAHPKIND